MGGEIHRVWPTAFAKASDHSFAISGEELEIGKRGQAWVAAAHHPPPFGVVVACGLTHPAPRLPRAHAIDNSAEPEAPT
jgi:hypothetical protein